MANDPRVWIQEHIQLYLTDPEKAHMWDASAAGFNATIPTLLLITRGRKTGKDIFSPLVYKEVNGGYVVIASRGGAPEHPNWYLNLKATPDCEIRVGRNKMMATARQTEGDERANIWQQMTQIYPFYDDYQKRAGERIIPVMMLDPKSA